MKKLALGALVGLLVCSTTAFGQDLDQKVRDLEKVVADQQKTISELLRRVDAREEVGTSWAAGEEESSWFNKIELSGDFRYRHEYINDDRKDRDRHRQRIRARLNLDAEVNEDVDVMFQLSTGGSATSGNATLTDMWEPKGIYLSIAAFDWHPSFAEGLSLVGGKMKIPFYLAQKSELIWDGDITPEGMLLQYKGDVSEEFQVMAQVFGFWTMERSSDADSGLVGGQLAGKYKFDAFDGGAHVLGILGCYRYSHPTDGDGDLVDIDDVDYHLYNGSLEFGATIAEIPVAAYFDYVTNSEESDEDMGWQVGFKVGKAKKPGQWEAKYLYRHVEMHAVFPAFADSDFGGGGANAEGHEIGVKVNLMKGWDLGAALFVNTVDIAKGEKEEDYLTFQLDLEFKF